MTKILCVCIVVSILSFSIIAKADIYQYRDKDGKLHFTDSLATVPPGKTPVILKETKDKEKSGGNAALMEARVAYSKHDYQDAVLYYSKIFEAEKNKPTLDPKDLRTVINNLGTSYIAIEKPEKAKEIFEYGLSKEKEYPLFYYNLARTYAKLDDFPKCVSTLRKAYEYRKNLAPGNRLPDPATDPIFARYMKKVVFRRLVEESKK